MIRSSNIILFIFTIIFIFSSSFYQTTIKDDTVTFICIIIGIILFVYWITIQQYSKFKNYWIKPSNILFLANIIVCFQWLSDDLLGYRPGAQFMRLGEDVYTECAILGVIATLGIELGYNTGILLKNPFHQIKHTNNSKQKSISFLVIALCIFFILFVININIIEFLTGASYGESNEVNASNYFEVLVNCAIIAILAQNAYNQLQSNSKISIKIFIKSFPIIFWIIVTLYLLLRSLSGDRGPVIFTILAIFYSYIFISKKRIKLHSLIVLGGIGAIAVSIMGIARSLDSKTAVNDKFYTALTSFTEKGRFGGKSICAPTQELSISFLCLNEAVLQIEKQNQDYNYGLYQLIHLTQAIPYAPSFIRENLGFKDDEISSTARVTHGALGYNNTWSLGTSMITDFYLDCGKFGVLLGCILIGLVYHWIDKMLIFQKKDFPVFLLAIVILFASKALYIPRSAFLAELRPLIYIVVLLFINNIYSSIKLNFKSYSTN